MVSSSLRNPQSVLVAHRYTLVQEGLMALLRDGGFMVCGHTSHPRHLVQSVREHPPDIVLVDWGLLDDPAAQIGSLSEAAPGKAIVLLTQPHSSEASRLALRAGARGCLSVNLSPKEFVQALHLLAQGNLIVSQEIAPALKKEFAEEGRQHPGDELTGREREVLGLVTQGATNREIASALFVTENTVKVHLRRILQKLNLRNRQQVAAYATSQRLIDSGGQREPDRRTTD
jgi:two-component system NarL family response regulator